MGGGRRKLRIDFREEVGGGRFEEWGRVLAGDEVASGGKGGRRSGGSGGGRKEDISAGTGCSEISRGNG